MNQQNIITGLKKNTPQLLLPDTQSTAEAVMDKAIEYCKKMMLAAEIDSVKRLLVQNNSNACKYCRYSIAKQVGCVLGELDHFVKAVYILDYDDSPDDLCFGVGTQSKLIHMIVHVERKTNALYSLVEALDQALVKCYAKIVCMDQLCHLLDVQMVDQVDIEKNVGYAALLSSLHYRPIQIWKEESFKNAI
ncbi:MAG: hypothetical protein JXA42_20405 [Anaerolineales bacterium]|nr:hypothetical protein [Anaerolineales bacterium]